MIEKFFKTALRESGLFEGVQIHSIVMPQGYNYPAIIFNRISASDEGSKNVKVGHLTSERWSFGIYAKTISLLKQLESSVKLTFDQTSNESFNIQSIYFADTSSDFYDEEFEVYSVNVDFYVRRIIDSEAGDLSTIVNPALTIFSKTYLITGTGDYNALLPLSGWAQPDGYDGNCAIVKFTDGIIGYYTYNNGWELDYYVISGDLSDLMTSSVTSDDSSVGITETTADRHTTYDLSVENADRYTLGDNITEPFINWTYYKAFVNGSEANISHWDIVANTVKHKTARATAGYRDRIAMAATLTKDSIYKVTWEIESYVSGSVTLNVGESFSFLSNANGVYTDYIIASEGDFIAIQSDTANLVVKNVTVQEIIADENVFFRKIYSKGGIKTDGLIEVGKNKRIMIGAWDSGTNFQDDEWQIYEQSQPSISIGYNSMSRGTGVVIGPNAGKENANGGYITAVGVNALRNNTIGHATGFGTGVAQKNTIGNVCAFGDESLANSVVTNNNGFGYYALNLATKDGSSAFGYQAARYIDGESNTAFGYMAMIGAVGATGFHNVAIGYMAMNSITDGVQNLAAGYYSMGATKTGGANIGLGHQSLRENITGFGNSIIGYNAAYKTNAHYNTAIGYEALLNNVTGASCVAIGCKAGKNNTSSNKLFIANTDTPTPLIGGDFSTSELLIGGMAGFSVTYPTDGTGVTNGNIFKGTDGALYYKGGSGTITKLANA